jgi:hypothetical protein
MHAQAQDERRWDVRKLQADRMGAGSMDDAMHLADTEFADRLAEEPGSVDYQAVAVGDDMAAEFVRQHMEAYQVERLDVFGGEVMVSRAADSCTACSRALLAQLALAAKSRSVTVIARAKVPSEDGSKPPPSDRTSSGR